jgi:hypothetical protein
MESDMKLVALAFLIAVGTAMEGCSDAPRTSTPNSEPRTVADLSRVYLGDVRWRLPDRDRDYLYLIDRNNFLRLHRDEMLKTLEVVETAETSNVAVGFVRYSIGATVYRDAIWMRKVDGQWRATLTQYFSDYEKDPFGDGKPEEAKVLIKRVSDWRGESPKAWW